MFNPMVAQQKYKTSLCRHFTTTGVCSMGQRCHFAHGQDEMRGPNDPLDPQLVSAATQQQEGLPGVGLSSFKAIKCRYFELGICKYSEGCHFAHGDEDSKKAALDSVSMNQMILAQQYAALLQQQEKLQQDQSKDDLEKQLQEKLLQEQKQQMDQQASQPAKPQQQVPQDNGYSVSKDIVVQKEITLKQIDFMLSEIKSLDLTKESLYRLNLLNEMMQIKSYGTVASLLDQIFTFESQQSAEKKKILNEAAEEAAEMAVNLMAEYSVKIKAKQQKEAEEQAELMKKQQEQMQLEQLLGTQIPNLLAPQGQQQQQQQQQQFQQPGMQQQFQMPGQQQGMMPPPPPPHMQGQQMIPPGQMNFLPPPPPPQFHQQM